MRDLIVVGSGTAGLFTALSAHRRGVRDVLIVTKATLEELTLGHRANATPPVRERLRALMWEEIGILRHRAGLDAARTALETWASARPADGVQSHETANLGLLGWVMAEAARRREESRGAHYRIDFPEPRREWRRRQAFVVRTRPWLGTHAVGDPRRAGVEVLS